MGTPAAELGGLGVSLGGLTALAASPWATPLLFHESAKDPMVFAVVAMVLGCVGIVAAAVPAFAASVLFDIVAIV